MINHGYRPMARFIFAIHEEHRKKIRKGTFFHKISNNQTIKQFVLKYLLYFLSDRTGEKNKTVDSNERQKQGKLLILGKNQTSVGVINGFSHDK